MELPPQEIRKQIKYQWYLIFFLISSRISGPASKGGIFTGVELGSKSKQGSLSPIVPSFLPKTSLYFPDMRLTLFLNLFSSSCDKSIRTIQFESSLGALTCGSSLMLPTDGMSSPGIGSMTSTTGIILSLGSCEGADDAKSASFSLITFDTDGSAFFRTKFDFECATSFLCT